MTVISNLVATAGKQVPLGPGDILEIEVSFDYQTSVATTATLWASLGIGIGRDMESFLDIELPATLANTNTWTGITDIQVPVSGIPDGTYWMKVEIDGEEVTIQGAVVLSGMPTTGIGQIGDLISMLVVMMMMMMMMNMMKDPLGTMFAAGEKVRYVRELPEKAKKVYEEVKGVPTATERAFEEELGRE